jgi:hypothetical protein
VNRLTRGVAALLLVATASARVAALGCEIACAIDSAAGHAVESAARAQRAVPSCHEPAAPASSRAARLAGAPSTSGCDHESAAPSILTSKPPTAVAAKAALASAVIPVGQVADCAGAPRRHSPPGVPLSAVVPLRI